MSWLFRLIFFIYAVSIGSSVSWGQSTFAYTGTVIWNAAATQITFTGSGSMPETQEGFFWSVPAQVKKIIIGRNVTVKGGFRVESRDSKNPLQITGIDRQSSIIYGTDEEKWTTRHSIPDKEKWRYGAVSVLGSAVVEISDLTAQNPRGYIFSGYAPGAILHVSRCNLLDTRPGDQNNSDGFIGAAGSSIRDSLISTSDDGIKIYHDITIRNVTIEQHRNGAALQLGWAKERGSALATITNLTLKGVSPDGSYHLAPISWQNGKNARRILRIKGLRVDYPSKVYDAKTGRSVPYGLFGIKPRGCQFQFEAEQVNLGQIEFGFCDAPCKIKVNGKSVR